MQDIKITLARKPGQLKQILELQAANVRDTLDEPTAAAQGFVTATHSLRMLREMTASAASVIALRDRRVVGYCLAMTAEYGRTIPVLTPVVDRQDAAVFRGAPLGESGYLAMGQICVAEEVRGRKLPDRMYKYLRGCYHPHFPYCVTAVDARNTRSLRVHERVGFERVDRFVAPDGRDWIIVAWDWRVGL
jgi:ribosomal protein S18 acetylase RimI-like enzyme